MRTHEPTEEQRNAVAIAAGGGMTHDEIAIGLGVDRNTLEKHYERELSEGAYLRRAQVIAALHSAALKGNASAAREYLARPPQLAVPPAPAEGEAKKTKLGKKEQANQDAKTATRGTDWGDLLPSRGSVQ